MANPEHLAILTQGVEAWNKWKKKYEEKLRLENTCDLSSSSFHRYFSDHSDHRYEPDFADAHLSGSFLMGADLINANLNGAYLIQANLMEAYLTAAHFRKAFMYEANLEKAHLEYTHFDYAHLNGANLEKAYLDHAYLLDVHMENANLARAHLEHTHFKLANLHGANLEGAYLYCAVLSGADLSGANLKGAYLYRADLSGANLKGANLEGANLDEVIINNGLYAIVEINIPQAVVNKLSVERLRSAIDNFMGLFGLDRKSEEEPVLGSYFQGIRYYFSKDKTQQELKDAYEKAKKALEAQYLRKPSAETTALLSSAAAQLLAQININELDEVAIRLGAILIIKTCLNGSKMLLIETMSPEMMCKLESDPTLLRNPHRAAIELNLISDPKIAHSEQIAT